jgi:hypothetical protein
LLAVDWAKANEDNQDFNDNPSVGGLRERKHRSKAGVLRSGKRKRGEQVPHCNEKFI